jgi:hypothetical protein
MLEDRSSQSMDRLDLNEEAEDGRICKGVMLPIFGRMADGEL